ncbi:FFLEELY motif protein [Paraglaciecola aestuariivivens]
MNEHLKEILRHLHGLQTMRDIAQQANLVDKIHSIQNWQNQRVLVSQQHLLQQPANHSALQFLINQCLTTQSFVQLEQELEKINPSWSKILPNKALALLASTLRLHSLNFELDFALAKQLGDTSLNKDNYADAYLACKNTPLRHQQISVLQQLGRDLTDYVQMPALTSLLFLYKAPAKMGDLSTLLLFFEDTFIAFKEVQNEVAFFDTFIAQEKKLMTHLLAPHLPNPLPDVTAL